MYVCLCKCMCVPSRVSVPAPGAVPWPQALLHPGAHNRQYWEPVAASGCTECLRPTTDRVYIAHMYIHFFTSGPPSCSSKRGK